jgi:hypothetical protein
MNWRLNASKVANLWSFQQLVSPTSCQDSMLHSQRPSAPEKSVCAGASAMLGQVRQSNRASKGLRHPKEGNGNGRSGRRQRIAGQPLCPRKSPLGTLCTRKRSGGRSLSGEGWLRHADLHVLMAREGGKGSPMKATARGAPQDWLGGQTDLV